MAASKYLARDRILNLVENNVQAQQLNERLHAALIGQFPIHEDNNLLSYQIKRVDR